MSLRPPSVTVSTHTSAFNAVAFQSPAMPNTRMSLWMQSVYSFSFPPRPLRTSPSRFPKTIRFGSRPPLILRSVPAHKSRLVRNVVSMLSHPVISRARLYEVIRGSGFLCCVPMIRSKTRWCTVRSLCDSGSLFFPICMYVRSILPAECDMDQPAVVARTCMVKHIARVWINRVRLPILRVVT